MRLKFVVKISTAMQRRNPNMLAITTNLELQAENVLPLTRLPKMSPTYTILPINPYSAPSTFRLAFMLAVLAGNRP
jgi:hypothetical protein